MKVPLGVEGNHRRRKLAWSLMTPSSRLCKKKSPATWAPAWQMPEVLEERIFLEACTLIEPGRSGHGWRLLPFLHVAGDIVSAFSALRQTDLKPINYPAGSRRKSYQG